MKFVDRDAVELVSSFGQCLHQRGKRPQFPRRSVYRLLHNATQRVAAGVEVGDVKYWTKILMFGEKM